jgi:hypothetical protein
MKKEADVKKELKKYLTEIGAWQYWPVSNGMGRHGIPDCLVCYRGHFIAIETKAPGRRGEENRGCSALQTNELTAIFDAGGSTFVFDGEEDDWAGLKDLTEGE